MKAPSDFDFTIVEPTKLSLGGFVKSLRNTYQNLVRVVNGNVGFGDGSNADNVSGVWLNTTCPVAPNTDFTLTHNLGRVPSGWWLMQKDRAVDVYTGSVAATNTQITLRATIASAVIRLFVLSILLFLFSFEVSAQGVAHSNTAYSNVTPSTSTGISGALPVIIPSAVVTVCNGSTIPPSGSVCTGLAGIYSNAALTNPLSNPMNADVNGNYYFYTAPGNYVVSVSGAGVIAYSYPVVLACPPSGCTFTGPTNLNGGGALNGSFSGPTTLTGVANLNGGGALNGSFSGPTTLTGPCNIGGALYLFPGCFAGADIGAQINAAITSSPGATIYVPFKSGGQYNYTTPIVETTASACSPIIGLGFTNQIGTAGVVLNYTPTTATNAITFDCTNSTGSSTQLVLLQNITLFNNNCTTVGGCGSSATGVAIGSTNGGVSKGILDTVNIKGFGTGFANPVNVSWGMTIRNGLFAYNNTGMNWASAENMLIVGTQFLVNGTGITSSTGEFSMVGGSIDSSTVVGATCTGAVGIQTIYFTDVHFENLGQSNTHFVSGTCNVNIKGGSASNDNVGGSSDWLFSAGGLAFTARDIEVNSLQTLTVGYFQDAGSARVDVSVVVGTPTAGNPLVGGASAATAYAKAINVSTSNTPALIQQGDTLSGCPYAIGDAAFTADTATCLHVKAANSKSAIRLDDTTDNQSVYIGPGIGGNFAFTVRDRINAKQGIQWAGNANPVVFPQGINPTGISPFTANTVALTADWTCGTGGTVASCVAATIIGSGGGVPLTFTLPLAAQSYTLECDGVVGQATAATLNQWNLLTATNGATNVTANYMMATAATASAYGAVTDTTSTTTTFQITPSWTLGGTATKMPFHIWAKIEGASVSGTVVSIQLVAPTIADLVTIYRGAACRLF